MFLCFFKFTGSIYRILKIQNTISSPKFALAKQADFINLSCCDKYHLTLYVNRTRHFPYSLTYHYPPVGLHWLTPLQPPPSPNTHPTPRGFLFFL